ncbi:hydrolase [Caulobacter phage CcrBL9]|uniref:peptidyl-tRNA hydrolase n=1 Tax=Caulobacter phage CcrBL9 TaxID=2283270 RepID=A0A385EBZ8_9CAUD|nr:hydrolase [Caulobacter phage CcrBL9]AXQ69414.1 hypothetical protein CcrBL9_gp390 [Caulobacter phage CcrBL9]
MSVYTQLPANGVPIRCLGSDKDYIERARVWAVENTKFTVAQIRPKENHGNVAENIMVFETFEQKRDFARKWLVGVHFAPLDKIPWERAYPDQPLFSDETWSAPPVRHEYSELVMYSIISEEALKAMKGNRGKLVSQGGHAYLHTWWDSERRFSSAAYAYRNSNAAVKVALRPMQDLALPDILVADTEDQLSALYDIFHPICGCTLTRDAARTVFTEPTVTFLGVGPIYKTLFNELAPGLRPLL